MKKVDVGVFAHNEAGGIRLFLAGLARQSIFADEVFSVQVVILANGCSDATVHVAEDAIRSLGMTQNVTVFETAQSGKSRTWNTFVHGISRQDADFMIMCDADIDLRDSGAFSGLMDILETAPRVAIATSRPVKDITIDQPPLGPIGKMIMAAGGTLNDWQKSVCGQLYAIRAGTARSFHLPIGLPVEDGFIRAMVLTNVLAEPENTDLIDGRENVFHVYVSERTLSGVVRHQTRIVIGGAVNAALFDHLRRKVEGEAPAVLRKAATSDAWLSDVLLKALPRYPFGWVPVHFLVKRLYRIRQRDGLPRSLRYYAVLLTGFCFDVLVYILAQFRMARGAGANYW